MQKNRRSIVGFAIVLMAAFAAIAASAAERKVFDARNFEAAQISGRPILVDISASWCPTCWAQKPTIDSLAAMSEFKDLIIFAVDFDNQKSVVRNFRAQSQSTLIAFRGQAETGRSVGDTDPESIRALVESAFSK